MALDARTPVIVGAGQIVRREALLDETCEPAAMIAQALRAAADDSGAGAALLRRADSVRCVPVIGWHYPDAAAFVAHELGAQPRETVRTATLGGEGPLLLLNETAADIAAGRVDVALLGGGESGASLRVAQLAGTQPAWRRQEEPAHPARIIGSERAPLNEVELAATLGPPLHAYALLETAIRASEGRTPQAHLERLAALWSRFSRVACGNPHAWSARAYDAVEISAPSAENRVVCAPYTKLLTANIQVNLASGLIVTSAAAAEAAGVPRERWVFVHAGAYAEEEWHVSERERLDASPAIAAAGRAVLDHARVGIDDVAHVDLYSCFPSAVQIAARELGMSLHDDARPPTVTGGLTFAGGPGNNYAAHAVATLVALLRADTHARGLATAVGWYLTKHAVSLLSAQPPTRPFASLTPAAPARAARTARHEYTGEAVLESYALPYERDGSAGAAIVSALTREGERVVLRTEDRAVIDTLLATDPLGAPLEIAAADGAVSIAAASSAGSAYDSEEGG
jgi:acetyl-CoA C-acetyltransferase